MLLTEAAAERTIDRDFDQTAVHIHGKKDCPTCDAVKAIHSGEEFCKNCEAPIPAGNIDYCSSECQYIHAYDPERVNELNPTRIGNTFPEHLRRPFDRHVSPAILEQRILDLTDELRQSQEQLANANERIKAFERFTANLAAHIDGMKQAVDQAIKPNTVFPKAA